MKIYLCQFKTKKAKQDKETLEALFVLYDKKQDLKNWFSFYCFKKNSQKEKIAFFF